MMSGIGAKDTAPEWAVRQALHSAGFRYRLHDRRLPGKPDIVLPRHKVVVFVHGCFWHRHRGCSNASTPKSNEAFWAEKFARNTERDQANVQRLLEQGWRVAIIWECATRYTEGFKDVPVLADWILGTGPFLEIGREG